MHIRAKQTDVYDADRIIDDNESVSIPEYIAAPWWRRNDFPSTVRVNSMCLHNLDPSFTSAFVAVCLSYVMEHLSTLWTPQVTTNHTCCGFYCLPCFSPLRHRPQMQSLCTQDVHNASVALDTIEHLSTPPYPLWFYPQPPPLHHDYQHKPHASHLHPFSVRQYSHRLINVLYAYVCDDGVQWRKMTKKKTQIDVWQSSLTTAKTTDIKFIHKPIYSFILT